VDFDPNLLDPYQRLIDVRLEGHGFQVPENQMLLRALQYLGYDLYPCRLCWNGDCDNCRFHYVDPADGEERSAKGCQTEVWPGMTITRLPARVRWP
jgi:hypothetical protein